MSGIDRRTLIGSRGKLADLTDVTATGAAVGKVLAPTAVSGGVPTAHGYRWPDLDEASGTRTTADGTTANLLGKVTRYDTTSAAISQALPPATAGAMLSIGWDAGTNALTLTAAGTDVIGSGASASLVLPLAGEVLTLHCTTAGRWRVTAGFKPQPALDARYVPIAAPARMYPGRRWVFFGDSITNGSSASNFAYSYSPQALGMAGTFHASAGSIEAGTSGDTAAQVLARVDTVLDTGGDAVSLLVGTNDAGASVSLASYQASVMAIAAKVRARGLPMVIGTVPGRTSNSAGLAASRPFIAAYNQWIRMWAPGRGIEVAEVWGALVDPATGDMAAAYDSGDGLHPNDLGHRRMAQVVSAAMLRSMGAGRPAGMVLAKEPSNLLTNPLVAATPAAGHPANTYGVAATGAAATASLVADTWGVLPAGLWAKVAMDATAAGGNFVRGFATAASGWAVGDVLALCGYIMVEDVAGTWEASVIAGTAAAAVALRNAASGVGIQPSTFNNPGRLVAAGRYQLGPIMLPVTIPSGVTSIDLTYSLTLPTGANANAYYGCLGLINLTTMGLASLAGATAMTNL